MRRLGIILGLAVFGLSITSCAPSGPSTLEVIDAFATSAVERDVEGMMALFAEDATVDESFRREGGDVYIYAGEEEIVRYWRSFFQFPVTSEFRDISVDGETATLGWVVIDSVYTRLYPVRIDVQNGKITYMDFYEESELLPKGDD